jgi:5-methylcytosine-specific restriction endonuclease McrA
MNVAELLSTLAAEQQRRAARAAARPDKDRYARFYRSRSWQAARWKFICSQEKPLRCAVCGATAHDTRLVVDHVVPLKAGGWARRTDQSNLRLLCNAENLIRPLVEIDETATPQKEHDHADAR